MSKLCDPFEEVQRAAGRPVRMATVLRLNGHAGKAGAGCDAPRLWQEGRVEQLERYCMRDVHALAELVGRREIRTGTQTVTRDASVAAVVHAQGVGTTAAEEDAAEEVHVVRVFSCASVVICRRLERVP